MVNYKLSNQRTITAGGITIPVPAGATIIYLTEPTNLAATADGMLKAGVAYQVTSGKTFHIFGVKVHYSGAGGGTVVFSSGDTENAETATILTLEVPDHTGSESHDDFQYVHDITLASAKFLTSNPSGGVVEQIVVIGYEI